MPQFPISHRIKTYTRKQYPTCKPDGQGIFALVNYTEMVKEKENQERDKRQNSNLNPTEFLPNMVCNTHNYKKE